jgi:hypothetical protein
MAKPLFGNRTTNGVEGESIALLYNDFRYQPVFQAILTNVAKCSEKRNTLENANKKLIKDWVTVYKKADKTMKDERRLCGQGQELICTSGNQLYNVMRHSGNTYLVDLEEKSCSRCVTRQQLCLPC